MTPRSVREVSGKPGGGSSPGHGRSRTGTGLTVACPVVSDGAAIWRIARDSGRLDLNSYYAYVLWCRDFSRTSAVVRIGGDVIGFVLGYLRPELPNTLMVWQVAVTERHRVSGVASTMLDELLRRVGPGHLETTISPDNAASVRLFTGLASRWGVTLTRKEFLGPTVFPDAHAAEDLFRCGPFPGAGEPSP